MSLTQDEVLAIQRDLARREIYTGPLDGVWSDATQEAADALALSLSGAPPLPEGLAESRYDPVTREWVASLRVEMTLRAPSPEALRAKAARRLRAWAQDAGAAALGDVLAGAGRARGAASEARRRAAVEAVLDTWEVTP